MSAAARRPGGEGADKAFWISFADLMTALMVLFLMVMCVALLAITQAATSAADVPTGAPSGTPSSTPTPDAAEPVPGATAALQRRIAAVAARHDGVRFDAERGVIDFGERARFPTASHRLDDAAAQALRAFVPQLLAITESAEGRAQVQRVVVEGFADPRGDYLFNLNLSLQRAQRVLCVLLDDTAADALGRADRDAVRDIFAVGGFSFNDGRESMPASRRVELRIEFGRRPAPRAEPAALGHCRLGA
jgi:outer membrane protein OmpA-like peptidoglycan-associated protein